MHTLPRVLIVSIPKGGTNLLMQVILGIPGMTRTQQNVCFSGKPIGISPGEMGVMHLPYSRLTESILRQKGVKVLFISRDPRDIAVSMTHFILQKFHAHVLYPAFIRYFTTNEERLSAIVRGLHFYEEISDTVLANELFVAHGSDQYPNIKQFCSPFLPWMNSHMICHVTFEELAFPSSARTCALNRIVEFLWDDLSGLGMNKGEFVTQMEQNIHPRLSPTFRAGRIGDWKSEFNLRHKSDFKSIAGDILVDLGYEKDSSW